MVSWYVYHKIMILEATLLITLWSIHNSEIKRKSPHQHWKPIKIHQNSPSFTGPWALRHAIPLPKPSSAAMRCTAARSASISASGRRPARRSSSAAASKSSAAAAGLGRPSSKASKTWEVSAGNDEPGKTCHGIDGTKIEKQMVGSCFWSPKIWSWWGWIHGTHMYTWYKAPETHVPKWSLGFIQCIKRVSFWN